MSTNEVETKRKMRQLIEKRGKTLKGSFRYWMAKVGGNGSGRRRALDNADVGSTQNSGIKKTIRSWIDEVRKRQRYLNFCSLFFFKVKSQRKIGKGNGLGVVF
jgi:hypothetical protein